MSGLADGALFLCGAYLCLRMIAAAYLALDLWYTIRTAYPRVVRGVLGWGGTSAAVAALAGDLHRRAFLCGLLAFLLFYLSLFVLRHLMLGKPAPLD
jgi:hypothetical protein